MIGNDVVDLSIATQQSNWRRKNYLDKVFTPLEQDFIRAAANPDEMVWSLWSRKEAVYKIIRQKGGKSGYYPKAIECLDTCSTNGKVRFKHTVYFTQTIIKDSLLQTLAVTKSSDFQFVTNVTTIYDIITINEIPYLVLEDKRYAASKSHHGRFEQVVGLVSQ
jgi:phosphopantetheinyl transferase (holo-ACP synthase)